MNFMPEPTFPSATAYNSERVLIAEDHDYSRNVLADLLAWKGYAVTTVADGDDALKVLASENPPSIALLDWEMPGMSGIDICRELRGNLLDRCIYLIIMTAREGEEGIVEAMAAGADDFIRKPFGVTEVIARVWNGQRTLGLERTLEARIAELQQALEGGLQVRRVLSICAHCKKLGTDSDHWQEPEDYIQEHFTHAVCPACLEEVRVQELGSQRRARPAARLHREAASCPPVSLSAR